MNNNLMENEMKRIVIGISGASGSILAIELLKAFRNLNDWETHLVITNGARITFEYEVEETIESIIALADYYYETDDIAAKISSGTFQTEGMIIIPCSMKTVAGIASGYSDNLVLRAADVTIKEKRKLVLVTREAPLSTIHLKNMLFLSECGAMILPPVVSFYTKPSSVEDIVKQIVGRVLNCFEIQDTNLKRWKSESGS